MVHFRVIWNTLLWFSLRTICFANRLSLLHSVYAKNWSDLSNCVNRSFGKIFSIKCIVPSLQLSF